MTEADWLDCVDPDLMLQFLSGRLSDRKYRLFACACCRRVRHWLTDPSSKLAIRVAERFADGRTDEDTLEKARKLADHGKNGDASIAAWYTSWRDAYVCAKSTAWYAAAAAAGRYAEKGSWDAERRRQAFLLREIVGNPFRRLEAPGPRSAALRQLAIALYAGKPVKQVLQGALRGVGYDRLADHFSKAHHPKGCWAMDLILGR